jgi:glucose/arabinose dehydrogenase
VSRRLLALFGIAAALVAVPPLGGTGAQAAERVRVFRCGGCWPAAFDFTPNGKYLFYVERFTGEVHKLNLDNHRNSRWGRVRGAGGSGEEGALGLALDPGWSKGPKQRWVYLYVSGGRNRIVRLRHKAGGGLARDQLVEFRSSQYHNGGVIDFGSDGLLYAVTGDTQRPSLAQRKSSPLGKVLRMRQNGRRATNNPFPNSRAFSFGHRNSYGFGFDPQTGRLWQTENGPECNDEINLIVPGGNYAWGPGGTSCPPGTNRSGPQPRRLPERTYTPVIAPTGAAFCDGCGLGQAAENDLLFGAWNDGIIRRLVLNGNRNGIAGQQQVFNNPSGVMAVEAAPNGRIHFSDPSGIYRLRT